MARGERVDLARRAPGKGARKRINRLRAVLATAVQAKLAAASCSGNTNQLANQAGG